jgi:hypothetical protein
MPIRIDALLSGVRQLRQQMLEPRYNHGGTIMKQLRWHMGGPIGLALVFAEVVLFCSEWAQAATGNGPYYPTPSWSRKLPAAKRFVVLKDWNHEAVLDRNTGLVWEQAPATTTHTWTTARSVCTARPTGGRMGWRLPSVHELASLIDPSLNFPILPLPVGHPFTNVQLSDYWSDSFTTDSLFLAWAVSFADAVSRPTDMSNSLHVWCVRGGMQDSVR